MNRAEEAIELVWKYVEHAISHDVQRPSVPFIRPHRIPCKSLIPRPSAASGVVLHVVCVKYGTLYGPEYVNKLYRGVTRFLTLPHDFICFTDNAANVDPHIKIIPLDDKYKGWWSKANMFNSNRIPFV